MRAFVAGDDGGLEPVGSQQETVLLPRRDDDGLPLGQGDALGVGDPVRRRDDDLLALVDERLDEVVERALGPGRDDDLVQGVGQAVVLLEARR